MEHNVRRQIIRSTLRQSGEVHSLPVRHQDLVGLADPGTTPRDCFADANFGMLQGMKPQPPVPTLEQLRGDCPWCWVVCERCLHRKPVAFTPLTRWGPDASSDLLRRSARCEKCGAKGGASLQHPSWFDEQVRWEKLWGTDGGGCGTIVVW
jgi:hypothetical protein